MRFVASPPARSSDLLVEVIEGRRRLIEATREAARWRTPKRRIHQKAVAK